jgi:hypothetical protein
MQVIGSSDLVPNFYLAGGTALALQLGHRRSVDLDFFTEVDAVRPSTHRHILSTLENLRPTVVEQEWGNLLLVIDDLHVGFFSYGYGLVAPTRQADGVPLAGLADIGLMKLDALASRGSRKDFCDLYFVAQRVSLRALFDLAPTKYPTIRDFEAMVVRYMADFDRADQETPLPLLQDVDWETIKTYFRRQAVLLGRRWLAQDE